HPPEPRGEAGSVLLVKVDEDLGGARRSEGVAGSLEVAPELAIVVDLTVLDDLDGAVLVADRLVAGREVDDRKPPGRERHRAVRVLAEAVGAAVGERRAHRRDALRIRRAAGGHDSADPAHAKESRHRVGSTRALHHPRPADPHGAAGGADDTPDRGSGTADPVSDLPRPRRPRAGLRAGNALSDSSTGRRPRRRPPAAALPVGLPYVAPGSPFQR